MRIGTGNNGIHEGIYWDETELCVVHISTGVKTSKTFKQDYPLCCNCWDFIAGESGTHEVEGQNSVLIEIILQPEQSLNESQKLLEFKGFFSFQFDLLRREEKKVISLCESLSLSVVTKSFIFSVLHFPKIDVDAGNNCNLFVSILDTEIMGEKTTLAF